MSNILAALRILIILVTALFCVPTTSAQNPIWVGSVEELTLVEPEKDKIEVTLVMKEDITDGKFEPFEPGNIFIISMLEKGKKAHIVIDGVGPGKYHDHEIKPRGLFNSGNITGTKGSYTDSSIQLTQSGEQVWSTEMEFESEESMGFELSSADEEDSTYTVKITFYNREKFETNGNGEEDTYEKIEVTADEFDQPPTTAMVLEGIGTNEWFDKVNESLSKVGEDVFITLVYPVMHLDPDTAANLVTHKLSVLGSIVVNKSTSSIIVTDVSEYAKAIVQTLALVDTKTPQVLIEVKIIEVSWDEELQAGIDWNWLDPGSNNAVAIGGSTATPGDFGGLSATVKHLSGNDLQSFATKINAFVEKGKAKLLARPKIIVLNNKKASFHAGNSVPSFRRSSLKRGADVSASEDLDEETTTYKSTDVDTTALTSGSSILYLGPFEDVSEYTSTNIGKSTDRNRSLSQDESFEEYWIDTGIKLEVTPQIRNSGEIILDIKPSVDEIVGYRTINLAPIISTRSVDSTVRVSNGETIVIGGLFREQEVKVKGGVPVLRSIPIAGLLFRKVRTEKVKTEIVFVLTTHLIK